MQQIPIESISAAINTNFPVMLTRQGQEAAFIISSEVYNQRIMDSKLKAVMSARICREEAMANGMTQDVLNEILKDIS